MTEQSSGTRWRGFSHKELYLMLHDGPGAQASTEPSRRWTELTATLNEVGHDLAATLDGSAAVWAGRAAGAAKDRLTTLVSWARTAADEADGMREAVDNQGAYIATARAEMPAPQGEQSLAPDPATAAAVQVAAVQNDAEAVEQARSAGAQKAYEVMATYELSTRTNLRARTGFARPAELLGGNQGDHRQRGDGVTQSTHTSFAGTPVAAPTVGGYEQSHRPAAYHGFGGQTSGGEHHWSGGQGLGLSSAALGDAPEVVRRAPVAPGMFSGAAPMAPEGSVIGLGGRVTGSGDSTTSDRRSGATPRGALGHGPLGGGGGPVSGSSSIGGDGFSGPGSSGQGLASSGSNAAATPMAPAGGGALSGGPLGGGDNKLGVRRVGPEALGSSQWFADAAEPNQSSSSSSSTRNLGGRRRELARDDEQVTESVSVYGDDHHLPPGVIGG
ncbi:PPE domain-containing protein [Actinokineospora terrae]|uniref:PPE family protein n=1 Tax=Actinokineospora terrae TaxID=155974 RepID=A0A1H9SDF4_9PSEU|nr:PPE domain-containing protein [Actinokineospora terrae]SER82403.1 PPE family protein [Actinokineospora terrae]